MFMRRMGLALWRTTICQKLPKDFEQKLLNYQRYITKLRKTGNLMGHIAMLYYSTLFVIVVVSVRARKLHS
jgi:hypothetical protein